jgi:hypothetical protein
MSEMVTWLNSDLEIHPVSVVEQKTHESKKNNNLEFNVTAFRNIRNESGANGFDLMCGIILQ